MRDSSDILQTRLSERLKFFIGLLCFLSFFGELRSQSFQDAALQANYLLRFPGFVHWEKDRDEVTTIGVAGSLPIIQELRKLVEARKEEGRQIRVVLVKEGVSLAGMDILFVGRGQKSLWKQYVDQAKEHSVVTVGEEKGFLEGGGLIEFSVLRNRLRFSINIEEASSYGLSFSSKLARLAL